MHAIIKSVATVSLSASLLLSPALAAAEAGGGLAWSVTPYVWATGTKLDLRFRDANLGGGELSFSDALDVLDAAFMLHVEGGRGNWSAFGDLTYIKISDTTQRQLLTIDSENKQVFFDAALAFWPGGEGSPLSVFGGVRYTGMDDQFRFSLNGSELAAVQSDDDYVDALFGVRYRFDLNKRWSLMTHADLSFGDSEGTYLLRADFAYTVGKREQNRILIGYQHKEAEFKSGDLRTDFTFSGPQVGFNFRF